MENTESTAEVVHRPELTIKEILVTAEIPVRGPEMFRETTADISHIGKASFAVNTETWECSGEVGGHPVIADAEWWKDQCQRVSDRVRESITTLKV